MQSEQVPEAELIARATQGDASAFGNLYERYLDQIYRYIYYSVMDHFAAEDLTEDVFLKAWKALPRFRSQGLTFGAWLYRIAHNSVIDRHRTRKSVLSLDQVFKLRDAAPTPEAVVQVNEETARLSSAIDRLNPRLQQVILCRFISDLSHAETAEVMGIAEGHVRVMQHRALKKLRRILMEKVD